MAIALIGIGIGITALYYNESLQQSEQEAEEDSRRLVATLEREGRARQAVDRIARERQQFLDRFQEEEAALFVEVSGIQELQSQLSSDATESLELLEQVIECWSRVEHAAVLAEQELRVQYGDLVAQLQALPSADATDHSLAGEESMLEQLVGVIRGARHEIENTQAVVDHSRRMLQQIEDERKRRSTPQWAEAHFEEFAGRFVSVAADVGTARLQVDRQFQFKTEYVSGNQLRGLIIITTWFPYDDATKLEDRLWLAFRDGKWRIHSLESYLLSHGIWQRSLSESSSREGYELVLQQVDLLHGNP